jgi:hypothetical protein
MGDVLRGLLGWTLRPLLRLVLVFVPVEDQWERLHVSIPVRSYGAGAIHDFDWYFSGESAVRVTSVGEIRAWLSTCRYVRDDDLFRERDFWQHPTTFEKLREGDCEDHAIWAWRKLVELGYDADLVFGRCPAPDADAEARACGHVWVVYRHEGQAFLFETVAKHEDRMVVPLGDAPPRYRPELGVDRERRRFAFNGYLLSLRDGVQRGTTEGRWTWASS